MWVTYKSGTLFTQNNIILNRNYIEIDDNGWIKNSETYFNNGEFLNSKGVCKFNYNIENNNTILGIKFSIPDEVVKYLKEDLGIRGLFFVR